MLCPFSPLFCFCFLLLFIPFPFPLLCVFFVSCGLAIAFFAVGFACFFFCCPWCRRGACEPATLRILLLVFLSWFILLLSLSLLLLPDAHTHIHTCRLRLTVISTSIYFVLTFTHPSPRGVLLSCLIVSEGWTWLHSGFVWGCCAGSHFQARKQFLVGSWYGSKPNQIPYEYILPQTAALTLTPTDHATYFSSQKHP